MPSVRSHTFLQKLVIHYKIAIRAVVFLFSNTSALGYGTVNELNPDLSLHRSCVGIPFATYNGTGERWVVLWQF